MDYLTHRGIKIPLIGFGTYRLGFDESNLSSEILTVKEGIERFGMTLIDTAEVYGDGKSECFIGKIIKDYDRKDFFIVDKILPGNAQNNGYITSCSNSLKRLGTDYIDLYLLHWREDLELQSVVDGMEDLKSKGLIKNWGVSNFDTKDMKELFECKNGFNCFCNQILYNICTRGPEYELIPWCKEHDVLIMAYSPLCHNKDALLSITQNPIIKDIAAKENKSPQSLLLSFVIRNKDIITVFKTSDVNRLNSNMQKVFTPISDDDLTVLSKVFKAPDRPTPLEKI